LPLCNLVLKETRSVNGNYNNPPPLTFGNRNKTHADANKKPSKALSTKATQNRLYKNFCRKLVLAQVKETSNGELKVP
jgi:hypothetical protein